MPRAIEAQIAALEPTYEQLCGLDWTGEEAASDVIVEMQVLDGRASRWTTPASALVTTLFKGDAPLDQRIAVRLVKDNRRRSTGRSLRSWPTSGG